MNDDFPAADLPGDPILTPLFKPKVDAGTGELVPSVSPQITSELAAKVGFELPDVTAIRRAAQRPLGCSASTTTPAET